MRTFWVNGAGVSLGDGTESSPFIYSQIVNYFNPDLGSACGVSPLGDDVLYMMNNISFSDTDTLFSIKRNIRSFNKWK